MIEFLFVRQHLQTWRPRKFLMLLYIRENDRRKKPNFNSKVVQ